MSVSSTDSLARRAIALSLRTTRYIASQEAAEKNNSRVNEVHRQTWAQQLMAAAYRLGLNVDAVRRLHISAVVAPQVQTHRAGPAGVWEDVDVYASHE